MRTTSSHSRSSCVLVQAYVRWYRGTRYCLAPCNNSCRFVSFAETTDLLRFRVSTSATRPTLGPRTGKCRNLLGAARRGWPGGLRQAGGVKEPVLDDVRRDAVIYCPLARPGQVGRSEERRAGIGGRS